MALGAARRWTMVIVLRGAISMMGDRKLVGISVQGTYENGYLVTWIAECGCSYVTRDDNVVEGSVVQCSKHP